MSNSFNMPLNFKYDELETTKVNILNSALWFGATAGTFTYVLSLTRLYSSSFEISYITDFVVLFIVWMLVLFRHKISSIVKSLALIIAILVVVAIDIYELGIFSANKVLLILIPFFAVIVVPVRAAAIITGFSLLAIAYLAYLHLNGTLQIVGGDDLGVVSWLINFMMIIIVGFLVILIVVKFNSTYKALVHSLKTKNEELVGAQDNLQSYQNDLEKMVENKTAELIEKNKELKKRQKATENALLQLEATQSKLIESEKMASLGLMASGIAHEINNPLNYIKGGITGLQSILENVKDEELKQNIDPLIQATLTGVNRANVIVKSMNAYSYDKNDQTQKVNLKQVIDNCLNIQEGSYLEGIKIEKSYSDDHCVITGYSGQLHQVFTNIIINAAQAMDGKGTLFISVEEALVNELKYVRVVIKDEGKGIAKADLGKIYDPFFTTKEAGEGTGLGMYIVKNIMEMHQGEIKIDSEIKKGTTITLLFPV